MTDNERNALLLELIDDISNVEIEFSQLNLKVKEIESKYDRLNTPLYGLIPVYFDQESIQPSGLVDEALSRLYQARQKAKDVIISNLSDDIKAKGDTKS